MMRDELPDAATLKRERELEKASAPSPPPKDKRKRLFQVINDKQQPHHVRAEAQRILDIGDTCAATEFNYRVAEFFEFYPA